MTTMSPEHKMLADYAEDRARRVRLETGALHTVVIIDYGENGGVQIGAQVPDMATLKRLLTAILKDADSERALIDDRRSS